MSGESFCIKFKSGLASEKLIKQVTQVIKWLESQSFASSHSLADFDLVDHIQVYPKRKCFTLWLCDIDPTDAVVSYKKFKLISEVFNA